MLRCHFPPSDLSIEHVADFAEGVQGSADEERGVLPRAGGGGGEEAQVASGQRVLAASRPQVAVGL